MKSKLSKQKPTTIVRVKQIMKEIWDGMRPTYLSSLYQSMRRRMCMVIDSNVWSSYLSGKKSRLPRLN